MTTKIHYSNADATSFFSVISDGRFHKTVPEGTPGAVRRDYETSDGKNGTKFELTPKKIEGIITKLGIFDGKYGKNILIGMGEEVTISLSASSPFGERFLEALPNIDTSKEVSLAPYPKYIGDDGKEKKAGIVIKQDGEKIADAYSTYDEKTKKWTNKAGYPLPEGDTKKFDSDDWKTYFIKVRKYLIGEIEKHPLFTEEFRGDDVIEEVGTAPELSEEEATKGLENF